MNEMFQSLYDLLVYVTTNYFAMPTEFQKAFPVSLCVKMRLFVSNIVNWSWNDEK